MIYETHIYISESGEEGDLITGSVAETLARIKEALSRPYTETIVFIVRKDDRQKLSKKSSISQETS